MKKTLDNADYVLLGTLRKNGKMVETPVWFAREGEYYYMFSEGKAGKVKRLRNFDTATLQPCNVTGKPLGDKLDARAELLENPEDVQAAHAALLRKYRWQMRSLDLLATVGRKINKRKFIRAWLA